MWGYLKKAEMGEEKRGRICFFGWGIFDRLTRLCHEHQQTENDRLDERCMCHTTQQATRPFTSTSRSVLSMCVCLVRTIGLTRGAVPRWQETTARRLHSAAMGWVALRACFLGR